MIIIRVVHLIEQDRITLSNVQNSLFTFQLHILSFGHYATMAIKYDVNSFIGLAPGFFVMLCFACGFTLTVVIWRNEATKPSKVSEREIERTIDRKRWRT